MSGRVVDLDVNPKDPTEFYVAYATGGLWHTTNNGQSFIPLFDHQDIIGIGDIAVNIAERSMELIQEPELKRLVDLPIMAEAAQKILKESLDAFVNSDAELAEKVIFNDNVVDDMYEQIFRELLTYMLEDPRAISRAIKLIFIAKHLERVGDHSANIAEMVIFLVRGQDIRHGTRLDRGR